MILSIFSVFIYHLCILLVWNGWLQCPHSLPSLKIGLFVSILLSFNGTLFRIQVLYQVLYALCKCFPNLWPVFSFSLQYHLQSGRFSFDRVAYLWFPFTGHASGVVSETPLPHPSHRLHLVWGLLWVDFCSKCETCVQVCALAHGQVFTPAPSVEKAVSLH